MPAANGALRALTRCRPSRGQLLQHERHRSTMFVLLNDGRTASGAIRWREGSSSQQRIGCKVDKEQQGGVAFAFVFAGQLRQDSQMSCLSPSPLVASTSAVSNRPSGVPHAPPVCRFRHKSSFWAGTQLQQRCSRRRGCQSTIRFRKPTSALLEVSQDTWEAEVLQV